MILSDGIIGQMMEKVVLPPFKPRRTDEQVIEECPWATTGKPVSRASNVITSLELMPDAMEKHNHHLQAKYAEVKKKEVRYELTHNEDAEYLIVAFGSAARIAENAIELAKEEGLKIALFRPITLWPFPEKELKEVAENKKGLLVVEINAGQMVEDVKLSLGNNLPIAQFGRLGGIVPEPDEIIKALKERLV